MAPPARTVPRQEKKKPLLRRVWDRGGKTAAVVGGSLLAAGLLGRSPVGKAALGGLANAAGRYLSSRVPLRGAARLGLQTNFLPPPSLRDIQKWYDTYDTTMEALHDGEDEEEAPPPPRRLEGKGKAGAQTDRGWVFHPDEV